MFPEKNLFNKFSFDADMFSNDNDTFTTAKKNGSDGNNNDFDPFGAPVTGNKNDNNNIGFGFDTDFANFEAFNIGDTHTTNGNSKNTSAWGGSLDEKNNNVKNKKVKKYQEQEVNKIGKFTGDYSDNFDKDLQDVLKRSVMEQ